MRWAKPRDLRLSLQSDVTAGRLVGAAIVARLHAEPAFVDQLQKAKAEYLRLAKAP
ncbi:Major phosphate-irrepressible acid phosphatase precursor [Serratia fonticola]|uniref:Major phosphate-irrepressible acid phosphatase n=1 Tax=Serratia fonticola TaxID=47917 RepID=A0A4U9WG59_SERFO|nr:Major phosphate-irrepressible acid phosphatase precursor [Serratia fonticola]